MQLTFRYQEIFEEIVDEIASKINLSINFVAENIASALYEVSYLKAREQLDCVARKCDEKRKLQNIRNNRDTKTSQKTSTLKSDRNLRKNCWEGNDCVSVVDRNELAVTVKSVSRCLRVCWSVCGDVLHVMKKRKKRNRMDGKRISVAVIKCTLNQADRTSNNSSNGDNDNNDTNDSYNSDDDNDNNNNNDCDYNYESGSYHDMDTYVSLERRFPPANRPTVDKLLIGLDESVFKPAISFSFTLPSCPRVER